MLLFFFAIESAKRKHATDHELFPWQEYVLIRLAALAEPTQFLHDQARTRCLRCAFAAATI
jgi:hypothetical protein